jgi:glycosyltransferase involved in cell wall biosynthesis
MSRGTPVVTENNLGVLETIENCVSGLLFENIGSAVEVLDKLNNADLLNRMKRYAVQTVSTKFCIDNIARKYADVWVELISNKKPTR